MPPAALAANKLAKSEKDDAEPLALARALAQLIQVGASLTWLNCGQVPDPFKLSSPIMQADEKNGDRICTNPNEGTIETAFRDGQVWTTTVARAVGAETKPIPRTARPRARYIFSPSDCVRYASSNSTVQEQ